MDLLQRTQEPSDLVFKDVFITNKRVISTNQLNVEYAVIFSKEQAASILQKLEREIEYYSDNLSKVRVFGKWHKIPRKQVAYGTTGLTYTFSGTTVPARPWTPIVKELRDVVCNLVNEEYHFVLVNRYNDGQDYIGEHRDNETDLVRDAPIASLSFGEQRDFVFKHKDARGRNCTKKLPPVKLSLESGSLLVMKPPTNDYWYHSLPIRKNCRNPRVNLTFRKIKHA